MKQPNWNSIFRLANGLLLIGAVIIPALAMTKALKQDWASLKTGGQVFRAACATCHGSSGTGDTTNERGFKIAVPDFTDCDFTSREPHADWFAIVYGQRQPCVRSRSSAERRGCQGARRNDRPPSYQTLGETRGPRWK